MKSFKGDLTNKFVSELIEKFKSGERKCADEPHNMDLSAIVIDTTQCLLDFVLANGEKSTFPLFLDDINSVTVSSLQSIFKEMS